jgi:uncharacterized protein Smg (DUF494 family)
MIRKIDASTNETTWNLASILSKVKFDEYEIQEYMNILQSEVNKRETKKPEMKIKRQKIELRCIREEKR